MIPFSAVTTELPEVLKTLGRGGALVIPRLVQTVSAAPLVTSEFTNGPGTPGVTRANA